MYTATAVHDADVPFEAVRIARQIAIETGKGFLAGDTGVGHFPKCPLNGVCPVNDFAEIAAQLLCAIVDDLDPGIDGLPPGGDAFDNHPLVALQQAFLAFSDHPGSTQLDPYDTAACEAFRNG